MWNGRSRNSGGNDVGNSRLIREVEQRIRQQGGCMREAVNVMPTVSIGPVERLRQQNADPADTIRSIYLRPRIALELPQLSNVIHTQLSAAALLRLWLPATRARYNRCFVGNQVRQFQSVTMAEFMPSYAKMKLIV